MSTQAGALRTHGMRPSFAVQDRPAPFMTRKAIEERDRWYRRLEAEGMEIDEPGFKSSRRRRVKGPARAELSHYKGAMGETGTLPDRAETDEETAARVNAWKFGGPRLVWDLDTAEFWRLMSAHVELLPVTYKGRAFLRRWAEIGDVRTAAGDVGISRWRARQVHERFVALLKRKKVLQ